MNKNVSPDGEFPYFGSHIREANGMMYVFFLICFQECQSENLECPAPPLSAPPDDPKTATIRDNIN
jgi:hypothetical protein